MMEAHYEKLSPEPAQKDRAVDFADLGVDALFVTAAAQEPELYHHHEIVGPGQYHRFGEGFYDVFIKCRYLQKKNDGRGVYFMTGTPISNTIAEVYTLQRYLQSDELKNKGIEYFDSLGIPPWADHQRLGA